MSYQILHSSATSTLIRIHLKMAFPFKTLFIHVRFSKGFSSLKLWKMLKSSYGACVRCNKSSLRWYRETRHNKFLTSSGIINILAKCNTYWGIRITPKNRCSMYDLKHSCPHIYAWQQLWVHFHECDMKVTFIFSIHIYLQYFHMTKRAPRF